MRRPSSTMTDCLTDDTLYVLAPHLLQPVSQQTVEALKTWSLIQAEKFREQVAKQRCLAETRHAQAERDRQDEAAQLAVVRAEHKTMSPPFLAKAMLLLTAAIIGLGAEYVLTFQTLPWILDIKKSSLLAILLSLSPVAATLAFDGILDRLLEQPWVQARLAAARGQTRQEWQNAERRMSWFLITLGVLILGMFIALGIARMEAVHWQTQLKASEFTTEVPSLMSLDLALIIFSIGVLMVTGWLLLLGLRYARHCARYVSLSHRLRRQTKRFLVARETAAEAAAEAVRWRTKEAQINLLTGLFAQWFFAHQVARLARHSTHPDLAQRVDRALAYLGLAVRPAAS